MIKALLDTNVVLDALAAREPFYAEAESIFLLAAEEKFKGFITANSITDIHYLIKKNTSEAAAREALRNLLHIFAVVDINAKDCEKSLESPVDDYEDALIVVCASKIDADYIITRDEDFLRTRSPVAVIAPSGFLKVGIPSPK
ncbi:MAG: PIN domain-containing protein [Syntrophorhabdaceae bacterium]|nr:PIN domain-containing protein [Syntrophorhabdaceae bacterium]